MRPRPLSRSQPTKPGKIDKKQRLNKKTKNLKVDESVLKQSLNTCVNGLDKVIKVMENGSEEVVHFLSNECSIIYECRICSSLFRSLANFIAHKRVYCKKKYTDAQKNFDGKIEEKMMSITSDFQKGILSTRSTSKKDIVNFLDSLQLSKGTTNETSPDLFALELEATKEALFHCFKHEGKHCSEERSATIGPDGRVIGSPRKTLNGANGDDESAIKNIRSSSPTSTIADDVESKLPCPHCPKKFPTEKSLQSHTKALHPAVARTYYACPCCKKYLANTWSVYRHLSKVHKKSNEQIRKLRPQIHKKQISGEDFSKNKQQSAESLLSSKKELISNEEEKEILNEGTKSNELHRCYICGKRFERRVAMLSHAQICRDKNSGLRVSSTPTDTIQIGENKEETDDASRSNSSSPPPTTKSGIEVRMYYEKNKSLNSSESPVPSPRGESMEDSSLQLKPTALALLASMPTARVVLTKTTVPVDPPTPTNDASSPTPSYRRGLSREFSPKAEDVISRYRVRQNLNNLFHEDVGETCTSVGKVAVESVYCSDTEDSNSACEFVFGARDIANCIGTINILDDEKPNKNIVPKVDPKVDNLNEEIESKIRVKRKLDLNIKQGIHSEDEKSELEIKFEDRIKRELDSYAEEEEEEDSDDDVEEEEEEDDDDSDDEEIREGGEVSCREKGAGKLANGPALLNEDDDQEEVGDDDEISSDDENQSENQSMNESNEQESNDDEEEEEEEDSDDLESDKLLTREDSLIKERALNGLLNGRHPAVSNSINPKYSISWMNRKINSYIDPSRRKCLLCFKTFHRPNLVRSHVATHLKIFNFKCMINSCNFKSFHKADMFKHLLRIHRKKEVRKNKSIYMKKITNDRLQTDESNSHVSPFTGHNVPTFINNSNNLENTRLNQVVSTKTNREGIVVKGFPKIALKRNTNVLAKNGESTSIDLEIIRNGEMEVDDDSQVVADNVSGATNITEFHTTKMQMYGTDVDELIINPDANSSEDKLRALMMQVIFGSGNNIKCNNSDQISDCDSDTLLLSTMNDTVI